MKPQHHAPPPLHATHAQPAHGGAREDVEPRWHAALAIAATALIYVALPEIVVVGYRWLPFAIVFPFEIVSMIALKVGRHTLNRVLGFFISMILTGFIMVSVGMLVYAIVAHREDPVPLLRSAMLLWVSNILIFAIWYWRLDAGGPNERDRVPGHTDGAFLFPQMTRPDGETTWSPQFIDYLFLAFNTATAFSPTDVPILSRWAKLLVMLESSISLAIVILLAGRAVNIM